MRKFKKTEKMIISLMDESKYNLYDCSEHGVFALKKDTDDGKCPYNCTGIITKIEEVSELKKQFTSGV